MTDDKRGSSPPGAVTQMGDLRLLNGKLLAMTPNRQRRRELQAKARKRKRANRR